MITIIVIIIIRRRKQLQNKQYSKNNKMIMIIITKQKAKYKREKVVNFVAYFKGFFRNKIRERRQLGFVTLNGNLTVNLKPTPRPLLNGKGQFTFLKVKSSHPSNIVAYPPKFEFLRN